MRVVLDTNILISAFINQDGPPGRALSLWLEKRYDLVTSPTQIEEFRRASRYERVKERVNRAEIGRLVNGLRQRTIMVEDLPPVDVSSDPDDNRIVATAIAGGASCLVTGDKSDLQVLETVQGMRILTARAFVELFEEATR